MKKSNWSKTAVIKIKKNGKTVKKFRCPNAMQQKYFDLAWDMASHMDLNKENPEDRFSVGTFEGKYPIDPEDLKVLYVLTKHAYFNMFFDDWVNECEDAYEKYLKDRKDPKTFSQWVNGQITALDPAVTL